MKNRRIKHKEYKNFEKIAAAFLTQKINDLQNDLANLKNSLHEKLKNKDNLIIQIRRANELQKLNKNLQISILQLKKSNESLKNSYHNIVNPIAEAQYLALANLYIPNINHNSSNSNFDPYKKYEK